MDKTDAAVAKIIEAIGAAAVRYGPDGADIAIRITQYRAIGLLLACIPALIGAWWLLRFAVVVGRQSLRQMDGLDGNIAHGVGGGIYFLAAGCMGLFFAGFALVNICTPNNWIGAIDGRLGLAMRILDKVL